MKKIELEGLEVIQKQEITTFKGGDKTKKFKATIKNTEDFADIQITITSEKPLDLIEGQEVAINIKQIQTKLSDHE